MEHLAQEDGPGFIFNTFYSHSCKTTMERILNTIPKQVQLLLLQEFPPPHASGWCKTRILKHLL